MAKDRLDAELVHCHTWYADLGGLLASQLWGVPYVLTIHSLEPLRPWKVEQLGRGYHLSAWMERTAIEQADAIVAVSRETREDVLRLFSVAPERVHVIHNGIDLEEYRPVAAADALARHGIAPVRPYLLFVGRITRQKGIMHLVHAIPALDPDLQVVLCAGAPDTPEIGQEMEAGVAKIAAARSGVVWIREMISRPDVIQLYSHAAMFCCPSVYEPFGIINLEAMACETAVVASAVGGIPEVVVSGKPAYWWIPASRPAPSSRPTPTPSPRVWPLRSISSPVTPPCVPALARTAAGACSEISAGMPSLAPPWTYIKPFWNAECRMIQPTLPRFMARLRPKSADVMIPAIGGGALRSSSPEVPLTSIDAWLSMTDGRG